ncbi:MAG TPA: hypothetical protein VLU46_13495, partial [Thermoanaerobaculia bacterium]|nr:hypothetical protein [Thermoanaerobaculia bacterium]
MSNSRYRPLARELGVFLLFVVLSVAMTWPLARHIDRAVSDPGDPFFTTWAMDWDDYATLHRGVRLFDANIFYPSARSLAFSENMYGVALLFFPLFAAGVAPLTIHNLALLLGFAVTGYAAYALARYVTHSTEGAIVGGIAYAFLGFRFHHLPHLHFVWTPFLPLMLLSLFAFARKPDMRRSILLAAAIVMNGLNSLHWLLFGTTALAIAVAVVAVTHGVVRNRRYWAGAAFAFVLAAVTLFPFVQPYREVAHSYGMQRTAADALPNSADWRDWLTPNLQSKLYSKWARGEAVGHERTLFPGVMVLVLAVAPLFAPPRRRIAAALDVVVLLALVAALYGWMTGEVHLAFVRYRGFAAPLVVALVAIVARIVVERPSRPHLPAEFPALATWIFIGALGARGLRGWFHTFLFDFVSPFRGIRMPVRWAMIAYTALAILVALGVLRIIGGRPRVARVAIAGAIAAAMLFELRTAPIRWYLVPLDPRPVYAWLEKTPISGGVIELPIAQEVEYEYMWQATQHHKPLLNGVSSYIPAQFDRLAAEYEHVPLSPSFLDALEERRCSLVIVHAGGLARRADVRQWLATSVASGRLMFLRRFDAGSRGDYVFAVTRIERAAARWRAPETPDPAGRTPEQNAQLFIRDAAWTYNGVTFGALESPPLGTIRGRLVVLGWAHSPFGL